MGAAVLAHVASAVDRTLLLDERSLRKLDDYLASESERYFKRVMMPNDSTLKYHYFLRFCKIDQKNQEIDG